MKNSSKKMKKEDKKRIALISTCWNDNEYRRKNNKYGGVTYYRLIKNMELLKEKYEVKFFGADIQQEVKGISTDAFYDKLTKSYDMIIVKQIDNATACQALITWCKRNGCILVQDFDDDMLAVRPDQPSSKMGYALGGHRRAYAAAMMSLADALIVSTQPLKESFQKTIKEVFNEDKDIYVFPNYNDTKDWDFPQPDKDPEKIIIGWAGSITHDADLMYVMPIIGKLLDKYDNVYAEFLGGILQGKIAYLTQSWSKKAKKKFRNIYGTPAWDKYPPLMRKQQWDIAIAPLIDDKFNISKSHIKWMEYAMCGVPTIASKVYPYFQPINGQKTIEHGVTGYLASTKKEWGTYLELLIENLEERKRIATNAFNYISENLQWKQHKNDYLEIVSTIFDKFEMK